jgi:hypothetical protein
MKTTLSLTLSEQDKKRLKPNVSAKINHIVLQFTDTEALTQRLATSRTSCLLDTSTYKKLQDLEKKLNHPIPKIVLAMLELTPTKSQEGAPHEP